MRDAARRQRFASWLETALGNDRAKLMQRTGLTKGRVTQLLDPDEPFGERAASNLARKLSLPEDYFERSVTADVAAIINDRGPKAWPNQQHPNKGQETPLAQLMSHPEKRIDPPQLTWESILALPLPDRFVLIVRDDAMAVPGQRGMAAGTRATFQRADEAQPGDDVLLADSDGNLYIRTYQLRRPGHWLAMARNPAFQPLDSKVDGLKVIGILKGYEWD